MGSMSWKKSSQLCFDGTGEKKSGACAEGDREVPGIVVDRFSWHRRRSAPDEPRGYHRLACPTAGRNQ